MSAAQYFAGSLGSGCNASGIHVTLPDFVNASQAWIFLSVVREGLWRKNSEFVYWITEIPHEILCVPPCVSPVPEVCDPLDSAGLQVNINRVTVLRRIIGFALGEGCNASGIHCDLARLRQCFASMDLNAVTSFEQTFDTCRSLIHNPVVIVVLRMAFHQIFLMCYFSL